MVDSIFQVVEPVTRKYPKSVIGDPSISQRKSCMLQKVRTYRKAGILQESFAYITPLSASDIESVKNVYPPYWPIYVNTADDMGRPFMFFYEGYFYSICGRFLYGYFPFLYQDM